MSGSGNIRFLQAFFYSDVACSSVLGGASIIDNSTGFAFTNSQLVSLNESSIYQLANNQGITTGNIACMKVFLNGSHESPDGVTCQSYTDIFCSGVTCTSSQSKSVSWAASPSACQTRYSYTRRSNSLLTMCAVGAVDGTFSGCTSTGSGLNNPGGLFVNNNYAYILNTSLDGDYVEKCAVSATDGTLSSCGTTLDELPSNTRSMTINAKYIYLTNATDNTVTKCDINAADGSIDAASCGATSGFPGAAGIDINNSYAYVANSTDSTIAKCAVSSSDGSLSSCTTTGTNFSDPRGVQNNNGYAYIPNFGSASVTKCTVNSSDGTFTDLSCNATGSGFSTPRGITISGSFAYVTDGNSVIKCTVHPVSGELSSCASTGTGYIAPSGISIY